MSANMSANEQWVPLVDCDGLAEKPKINQDFLNTAEYKEAMTAECAELDNLLATLARMAPPYEA